MGKSVDERFREDLESQYDALMRVVTDALESKKKVWVEGGCVRCGCPHKFQVEVENVDLAMKAVEFLSNRGIGRPGTAEQVVEVVAPVFVRKVIYEGAGPAG